MRDEVAKFTVEGDLRREVTMSIKRLMDLGVLSRGAPSSGLPFVASARVPMPVPARGRARRSPGKKQSGIRHGKDCCEGSQEDQKNVAEGIAHVHASFNNTIITITDRQGNALSGPPPVAPGFQGFPARAPRSLPRLPPSGWQGGYRVGHQEPEVRVKGPGPGRESSSRAERAGYQDHHDHRYHADPAQRLPSAEEASYLTRS